MSDVAVVPEVAVLAARLEQAWNALLNEHWTGVGDFGPFGLHLLGGAGEVIASFMEEGIVFYPNNEEEK